MTVTYAWEVGPLDVESTDEHTNVVKAVHWRMVASEDSMSASVYGCQELASPGEEFTEYNDLTKDQVVGWVIDAMDESEGTLQARARQKLAFRQSQQTATVPWE